MGKRKRYTAEEKIKITVPVIITANYYWLRMDSFIEAGRKNSLVLFKRQGYQLFSALSNISNNGFLTLKFSVF